MNGKAAFLLAGALIGASSVVLSRLHLVTAMAPAQAAQADRYDLSRLRIVFDAVRNDYVEDPGASVLVDGAIKGMVASLDPHSLYMNAKDLKRFDSIATGRFGGIGVEIGLREGAVKVVSALDDTPAARAGLLADDQIVKIDGEGVHGLQLSQAVDKMRGAIGTAVTLTVVRKGVDEPFDVKLVREQIVIHPVKSRVEGRVGYIRITTFNQQAASGLKDAIARIQSDIGKDKVQGYILDLRNDPGGLIDQAVKVSDDFLDGGEILSQRGRARGADRSWKALRGDLTRGKPIIVLVNGGSASASEVVAGALQDHRRATVLGTRSFGKGSVQKDFPFGASGGLVLTIARYFTPSGRSIQAKGIEPDVVVAEDLPPGLTDATRALKGEAGLRGHLAGAAGKEESGSSAYVPPDPKDDKQLNYALDLIRGVLVDPAFPPDPRKGVPN